MVQTNAERCAKYRTENQEKFQLVAAMQQFKRCKELASGTPEAEKMRKAAAMRKRMQRMRAKESSGRIVTGGAERRNENEGDNFVLFSIVKISIIFIIISFIIIMFIMSNRHQVAKS